MSAFPGTAWPSDGPAEDNHRPKEPDSLQAIPRRKQDEAYTRENCDREKEMPDPEEDTAISGRLDERDAQGASSEPNEPPRGPWIDAHAEAPCQAQEHRSDDELGQKRRQSGVTCAPHGRSMGRATLG